MPRAKPDPEMEELGEKVLQQVRPLLNSIFGQCEEQVKVLEYLAKELIVRSMVVSAQLGSKKKIETVINSIGARATHKWVHVAPREAKKREKGLQDGSCT